jgi:heme/copper-type cytochrome/quinol oxidase subunit 2
MPGELSSISAMTPLASDPLFPIRVLAGIAFIAVVCAFVYVLRHLRKIEKTIAADALVPKELGPRNNLVLLICAIPVIVVALLLFLIVKT